MFLLEDNKTLKTGNITMLLYMMTVDSNIPELIDYYYFINIEKYI